VYSLDLEKYLTPEELEQHHKANEIIRQKLEVDNYKSQFTGKAAISDFMRDIKNRLSTPPTPTGFVNLDRILEGGLYEGLYIMGAISSLGKTTYVLQLADQIAQQGKQVMIFSLEMSKYELIAKSLSRLTFIKCNGNDHNAKTTRGILAGNRYINYSQEEIELIEKSIKSYAEYGDNIFMYEGMGDITVETIKDVVELHYRHMREYPVIIIDYLQQIAPMDYKITDKQNIDQITRYLKIMSRDYKTPIIAISSVNRASYKDKAAMQMFKESGSIEFSSDVLLGLQLEGVGEKDFDVDEEKSKTVRNVELVVLKNRNGRTGDTLKYRYYTLFNLFEEEDLKVYDNKRVR
jgi:replicative DNA helicase